MQMVDRGGGAAADVLAQAAEAPAAAEGDAGTGATKLRRSAENLTLELEPTPDLLTACAARRHPGQILVGFALEPRDKLETSARRKLARKGVDAIVANPLETMDAQTIEATLYRADGHAEATPGAMAKTDFVPWLLDRIDAMRSAG